MEHDHRNTRPQPGHAARHWHHTSRSVRLTITPRQIGALPRCRSHSSSKQHPWPQSWCAVNQPQRSRVVAALLLEPLFRQAPYWKRPIPVLVLLPPLVATEDNFEDRCAPSLEWSRSGSRARACGGPILLGTLCLAPQAPYWKGAAFRRASTPQPLPHGARYEGCNSLFASPPKNLSGLLRGQITGQNLKGQSEIRYFFLSTDGAQTFSA